MGHVDFKPILSEILSVTNDVKFSTMYFGKHCGKNVLILKHESKTILVVLKDDDDCTVEYHTLVSSRGKSIKTVYKIAGNQNTVLLLDGDGKLWRLINAFEFSNERDECLYCIDRNSFYEWVPFKKFQSFKVLEMTELGSGFAFLLQNGKGEKTLKLYSAINFNVLSDYTFDRLNTSKSKKYYLTCIQTRVRTDDDIVPDERLLIWDADSGRTEMCLKNGKSLLLSMSPYRLVSILNFAPSNCVTLCYDNGKMEWFRFTSTFDALISCKTDYLFRKVVSIVRCHCAQFCMLWSDGFILNHTSAQFGRDNYIELSHLHMARDIMGVRALVRVHAGVLAVTANDFYYHITVHKTDLPVSYINRTLGKVMDDMFKAGLEVDALDKDMSKVSSYVMFKEIIQRDGAADLMEVSRDGDCILVKSRLTWVFRKTFWRIQQSACVNDVYYVEMADLETDLCEGMTVRVKSGLTAKDVVHVSLIGDYGTGFELLVLYVGPVDVDKNRERDDIARNLTEIAAKRNPYLG